MIVFDRSKLRYPERGQFIDVLHDFVASELLERLLFVQRPFATGLICGPGSESQLSTWGTLPIQWTYASPARLGCEDLLCDLSLPFCRSFPLVISQNALHLTNDPVRALVELRGALVPDGLFLGAAAARGTLHELAASLVAAEADLTGGAAMRLAPLADIRTWGDGLAKAGFAMPVADEVAVTLRYSTLSALFADLRGMGARGMLSEHRPAPRRLFERAEAIYKERFADPDGRLRASFVFAFLSGWAPDKSQRKAAKPGSATVSLADALKGFGG